MEIVKTGRTTEEIVALLENAADHSTMCSHCSCD